MRECLEYYDGLVLGFGGDALFVAMACDLERDLRSYFTMPADRATRRALERYGEPRFLPSVALHTLLRTRALPRRLALGVYRGEQRVGEHEVVAKRVRRELRNRARQERAERARGVDRGIVEFALRASCRERFLPPACLDP